jgi:hypothetical protein
VTAAKLSAVGCEGADGGCGGYTFECKGYGIEIKKCETVMVDGFPFEIPVGHEECFPKTGERAK